MPLGGAAIMGGASLLGGLFGSSAASKDREAANAARQQALQQYLSIHVPDVAQQKVILDHYKQTGQMDPKLEQSFNQSQSQLGGIALDPTSKLAQMSALSKMQGIADQGGLDAQAKDKLQQGINTANTNEQGQRDAIVQNFAQRGMNGSGAALQAQLLASQSDANRASQQGLQASSDAEMRALSAIQGSATLGSNIRSQDYGIASDAARAQDAINQFNTRNSQQVAGANTDRSNQAQMSNLQQAQRTSDANTGVNNEQEMHNQGLIQKNYDNQLNRAAGATGQFQKVGDQDNANADRSAGQWSGVGQAIGQGATAYGQAKNNQDTLNAYKDRSDVMRANKQNSDGSYNAIDPSQSSGG